MAETIDIETASKLKALKIQAEREEAEKREKYILHMIQYLESKFSKNQDPQYIGIYGLYDWVEQDLYGQYEFFKTDENLYHVKRLPVMQNNAI
jgi:hypothetical protein